MIRKLNLKIQKLEQQKQTKVEKLTLLQSEIDEIDINLKKLQSFKREYEKLEKNSSDYLNSLGGRNSEQSGQKAA